MKNLPDGTIVRLIKYAGSRPGNRSSEYFTVGIVRDGLKYPSLLQSLTASVGAKGAREFCAVEWITGGLQDGFYLQGRMIELKGWSA